MNLIFFSSLLLFCTIGPTLSCFFSGRQKAPETPLMTVERIPEPAKSTRSTFYLEIEEDLDQVTTIKLVEKAPKAHSQEMDRNLQEKVVSGTLPPIESLVVEGEEEEALTAEDIQARADWKGTCTAKHWSRCSQLEELRQTRVYNKTKDGVVTWLDYTRPCQNFNISCLKNGWTVNKCQVICIATTCNKELLTNYDKFVSHEGVCNYT